MVNVSFIVGAAILVLCSNNIPVVSCSSSCCGEGWPIFEANLTSGESYIEPRSGLSWVRALYSPRARGGPCEMQGVLKIVFPTACNRMQRRRLQFDFYFAPNSTGWNFNIADSISCNGYGGDGGHTSNAAEVHNVNKNFLVYTNTLPGRRDYTTNNHLTVDTPANVITNHVTVTIGDEYVNFDNNRGVQKTYRSEYLYTLSGQPTTYGPVDYILYFGMNRVVSPTFSNHASRTGQGLCGVVVKALDC